MTDLPLDPYRDRPGLLQSLWATRWISLTIIGLVTAIAGCLALLATPAFTASAAVVLADATTTAGGGGALPGDVQRRYLSDQAAFVTSEAVLSRAADQIGDDVDVDDLRGRVSAAPDAEANILRVSASGLTERSATQLADAVVAAFRTESRAEFQAQTAVALRALDETAASLRTGGSDAAAVSEQALQSLTTRSVELRVRAGTFGDGVRFANPAQIEAVGLLSSPLTRSLIVGFAVGVLLASAVALRRTRPSTPALGQSQPVARRRQRPPTDLLSTGS